MGARQGEAGVAGAELDGLPEIYRELVDVVGLEAALRLARYLGGTQQYFPRYDRIELAERNRCIRAEFDGRNQRDLARRYRLTTRQIREVLRARGGEPPRGELPLAPLPGREGEAKRPGKP